MLGFFEAPDAAVEVVKPSIQAIGAGLLPFIDPHERLLHFIDAGDEPEDERGQAGGHQRGDHAGGPFHRRRDLSSRIVGREKLGLQAGKMAVDLRKAISVFHQRDVGRLLGQVFNGGERCWICSGHGIGMVDGVARAKVEAR